MSLPVYDLPNGAFGLAYALCEIGDGFAALSQMIDQFHRHYVPAAGTLRKHDLCPERHRDGNALFGHKAAMVPNNLALLRNRKGMTQDALAEAVGTTRNTITKLESGARPLHTGWLDKLAEALEVEPFLIIAPERFFPTEDELAEMILGAQQRLPTGLPYSEWPRAVATGLHMRLLTLANDRATSVDRDDPSQDH